MMKRLLNGLAVVAMCFSLFAAPLALADANNQIFNACNNVSQSAKSGSPVCTTNQTPSQNPVVSKINVAATIVALIAGVAAVVMIIVSGLTFVSSGGNPEAVASAKKQLTYAIAGLVIVALAWAITRFVVDVIL